MPRIVIHNHLPGDSDYKYEVFLKEGWCWQNGRNAGGRTGFFHNVGEFLRATQFVNNL
jgi:hypothetical protein